MNVGKEFVGWRKPCGFMRSEPRQPVFLVCSKVVGDVVPGVVPAAGGVASPCDHAELAKLTKHSKKPRVLEVHRLEGLGAFSCMPLP